MRAAVLGHPIAHSLSPVLHGAAHRALGLTGWSYDVLDVPRERLAATVAALDATWAGLSLTMPLKRDVIDLLDEVSELASAVGAVNTVVPAPRGAGQAADGRWRGENTDVHGLVAAVREARLPAPASGAVLGGGATAASALAALVALGVDEPAVLVRSPQRAGELLAVAERLGSSPHLVPWPVEGVPSVLIGADLVVATTPAGASDALARALADAPPPRGLLLDVVYAPRPTPLVAAWRARGAPALDGTGMLLHQAGEQVRLMTGRPAPLQAMRAALEAALAGH